MSTHTTYGKVDEPNEVDSEPGELASQMTIVQSGCDNEAAVGEGRSRPHDKTPSPCNRKQIIFLLPLLVAAVMLLKLQSDVKWVQDTLLKDKEDALVSAFIPLSAMASFVMEHTDSGGLVSKNRKKMTVQLSLAAMFNDVPGDFVELGVFGGGTAILMAKVLNTYDRSSPLRVLWAADSFKGLPDDSKFNTSEETNVFGKITVQLLGTKGLFKAPRDIFEANIRKNGLSGANRINILEGWFNETLPKAPIKRISFLRLDGDIFASTWQGLDLLYGKLSKGGFIYVDDYGGFSGCKAAVDKYRKERGISEPMFPVYEDVSGKYEAVWWQRSNGGK